MIPLLLMLIAPNPHFDGALYDLGHPDYRVREDASDRMRGMPLGRILLAMQHDDLLPEQHIRLHNAIVARFTPKPIIQEPDDEQQRIDHLWGEFDD